MNRLQAVADFGPVRVMRRFADDGGPNLAVLIAWNFLQSIFPIALALAALAGLVLSRLGLSSSDVTRLVVKILPNNHGAQQKAVAAIGAIQHGSGLLALLALAGFLWSGTGLFSAMEQAFDQVLGVPVRSFIPQRLMGLALMVILTVLVVLAVGSSALLPLLYSLPEVPFKLNQGPAGFALQVLIGGLSGVLLFLVLYVVVPNRRLRITDALPGALFAGIAFELLSLLFPLYLSLNRGINQYGAYFAFLFVLLIYFYFLGLITILGIAINAVWIEHRAPVQHLQPRAEVFLAQPGRRSRLRQVVLSLAAGGMGVLLAFPSLTRRRRSSADWLFSRRQIANISLIT